MTCGVALQSVRQSGSLKEACGRQPNGNSLRKPRLYSVDIAPVLDGRNRRALATITRDVAPPGSQCRQAQRAR